MNFLLAALLTVVPATLAFAADKPIMAKMDEDGDGKVSRKEFIEHCGLPEDLANAVFNEFDTESNGELVIPEYLRIWGRWARSGDCEP